MVFLLGLIVFGVLSVVWVPAIAPVAAAFPFSLDPKLRCISRPEGRLVRLGLGIGVSSSSVPSFTLAAFDVLGLPASSSDASSSESSESSARAAEAEVESREVDAREAARLFVEGRVVDALRLVEAAVCFVPVFLLEVAAGFASAAFALRLVDAAVGLAYEEVRFLDGAGSGEGDLDAEGKMPLVWVGVCAVCGCVLRNSSTGWKFRSAQVRGGGAHTAGSGRMGIQE